MLRFPVDLCILLLVISPPVLSEPTGDVSNLSSITSSHGLNSEKSQSESKANLRYSELGFKKTPNDDDECVLNGDNHFFWDTIGQDDHYVRAYSRINRLLVKRLKNNLKVDDNFLSIYDILEELTKDKPKIGSNKANLVDALEQLANLSNTVGSQDYCDSHALSILRANDLATRGRARGGSIPKCRVDKIVQSFALEHARSCTNVYLSRFRSLMKHYSIKDLPKSLKLLLADEKITKIDLYKLLNFQVDLDFKSINNQVLHTLMLVSRGDVNYVEITRQGMKPVDRMVVQRLFDTYLVGPCQSYVDFFGVKLFDPAFFDFLWLAQAMKLENNVGFQLDPLGLSESMFFHAMLLNQRCRALISKREEIVKLIIPIIPK